MFKTKIKQLRISAYIEGWSFLILLFIAMPLKYILGILIATKIVGMLHGLLFIWFLGTLFSASREQKFSFLFTSIAFLSSLIPFGTFVLDKFLKPFDGDRGIFEQINKT